MTFGKALGALRTNDRVCRERWVKDGLWVTSQGPFPDIPIDFDAAQVTDRSVPHLMMNTADGGLVPWFASPADMAADDWQIAP